MTKHPRYQHSLEDLFSHVYVLVDDWLKENETQFALPKQRTQQATASCSRSPSSASWWHSLVSLFGLERAKPGPLGLVHWSVTQSYRTLFPKLPEYSRYHRIIRNAEKLWAALALELVRSLPEAELKIVDAKPLSVAKGKRAHWAKCLEASKGFSTMGMVYGFKLHALVNEQGLFERWSFAAAHHHEAALVSERTEAMTAPIIGDKAYLGFEQVTTPNRKNMTKLDRWNKTLNRLRKRIETSFSLLVGSLTLHAAQMKTFRSLWARVNLKIAVHNLVHSKVLFGWQTG